MSKSGTVPPMGGQLKTLVISINPCLKLNVNSNHYYSNISGWKCLMNLTLYFGKEGNTVASIYSNRIEKNIK